ncbi:MAG: pyruvate ferredoxin oxidoreductase [Deltaproteobacteria bacterium]|nr:MAG: pyruvate ferredoxin oxidoreductase [Deltaproteobacteria bacterium]
MEKRIGLETSIAVAEAVGLCDADVVAAYPITPQTHIVEHLSELVADGKLEAAFVPVESEHSAMSVCCGTAATGARTFTATSSQGLALMHEIVFIASAMRLPIVMTVANRALSAPISIWNDHSDIMAERDVGWVQIFAENAQEALDLTIWAFRLAEDRRVSLPVMVNFDGFILTHTIEPVLMPDREMVQAFLPPFQPLQRLDVDNPITMGPVGIPDIYPETRYAHQQVLAAAYGPITETLEEFARHFGRSYYPVETYRADDAEILLVTMGALGQTAMEVVDARRRRGEKVGLVRLRLWRPFPFAALARVLDGARVVGVIDRAVSVGGPVGPVASEIKAAGYGASRQPPIMNFIVGLGGRDVPTDDFELMFDRLGQVAAGGRVGEPVFVGLRE